jgi:XTP/dITP diphosphohydrolase
MRISAGQRIVIATHNAGKLHEFVELLAPFGIDARSAADLGLAEPAETEMTFVGNARIKAHAAARSSGLMALADDSGVTIDALDGAPGVHTADWATTPNGRDFGLAMLRTWTLLEARAAPYPRKAQFRSTLVLAHPDGSDLVFEGEMAGRIVWPKRGQSGHGYDPIFQPDGFGVTFAEMPLEQKNRISHRAQAFARFKQECLG